MGRLRSIAAIMMIFASALVASQLAAQTAPGVTLTDKQQKVLDYMLNDWNKPSRITGVELAMQNVGGQYSPDDRYAIGIFLRDNPRLHRTLRTFGWETATLTPNEKLIARIVSHAECENQTPPSRKEFARILEVSSAEVNDALKTFGRFGIMQSDPVVKGLWYRMSEDRYQDWEGAMRITFMNHRVQVAGEKPFEVY